MMELNNPVLIVTNKKSFFKDASVQFNQHFSADTGAAVNAFKTCSFGAALSYPKEIEPLMVVIDLTEEEVSILALIKRITAHFASSRIICVGHPSDVSLVLELVNMGVKDFLKFPFQPDAIKSLYNDLMTEKSAGQSNAGQTGRVLTAFSPKGGVGVTFLASNLAVALAKEFDEKVVLCDFSPQCGDVATYLNIAPKYTMRDIIDNNPFLDISFLEGVMKTHHPTGIKVLPAPRLEQETINFEHLDVIENILNILKKSYDTIIIDAGHLDPTLLQFAMTESDTVFLVGNPDVISIRGLIACFNNLRNLDMDAEKIKVIINRHNSKNRVETSEFEKKTKQRIFAELPNNYGLCIESINTGIPVSLIQEKADISKKIREWAVKIGEFRKVEGGEGSNGKMGLSKKISGLAHKIKNIGKSNIGKLVDTKPQTHSDENIHEDEIADLVDSVDEVQEEDMKEPELPREPIRVPEFVNEVNVTENIPAALGGKTKNLYSLAKRKVS